MRVFYNVFMHVDKSSRAISFLLCAECQSAFENVFPGSNNNTNEKMRSRASANGLWHDVESTETQGKLYSELGTQRKLYIELGAKGKLYSTC